jgi:hypothetical protein
MRRVVVVDGESDATIGDQVSGARASVAAGQPGGAHISRASGREIDSVDGKALSIGLRQGHRCLADRDR